MDQKLNSFLLVVCLLFGLPGMCQEENPTHPKNPDYKNDTSYTNYHRLRFKVAKAQINLLKNGGAIFVRLKTNANTIHKLRAAGNVDLATQVERETKLTNKIIVASYLQELTFCPVYFFYSNSSDSVKHKILEGIFVDSNLQVNPTIVCNANFYLIAEGGQIYNSSLGIVPESEAAKAIERGNTTSSAQIILKNRYFIQLHKPFPYFQIYRSFNTPIKPSSQGTSIDLTALHIQIKKMLNNSLEAKQLVGLRASVRALNEKLFEYYKENEGYVLPADLTQYVY